MKIERFMDLDGNMDPWEHGDWVRFEDAEEAVTAERAACAELVRAAGCICPNLASAELGAYGGMPFRGRFDFHLDQPLVEHDPRCPQALAAAILARGQS